MTELQLYKAILKLAEQAEEIGAGQIADDLIATADYLQTKININ